jgi:citron Rho-interacting kinase
MKLSNLQDEVENAKARTVTNDKTKELEKKLAESSSQIVELKKLNETWETKANDAEDASSRLRREKEELSEELTEKERAATSQDLTVQMLKQTCTMLEGQVEELEVMNDEYQDREAQFTAMKRAHYQQQEKMEQQLTEALNSLEQQRLLRNKAEEKLRENEELSVKTRKMALHMDDI